VRRRPGKSAGADQSDQGGASDADIEYFLSAMADVIRIVQDPRGRIRAPGYTGETRPARRPTPPASEQDSEDGADTGFVAAGVDRRELRKLRRGGHSPAERLDLHGMTVSEALTTLTRFIDDRRHRRCICIVHGRGLHSKGSISVIKTRVRQWLRQHRAVLAYSDAPRADGGAGAVYVLLRK
jgi:DNA-nicking Smr family endonuclease